MGSMLNTMQFYRDQFSDFIYEPPRAHAEVLKLMRSCDVLVLPSIVEGRALVQQEAMMCGLPVIAIANAGAEDLLRDTGAGFLVPIRSPEVIAEKISLFADRKDLVDEMGNRARGVAERLTWQRYAGLITNVLHSTI